jgi:uncharacterized protein with PIN domain
MQAGAPKCRGDCLSSGAAKRNRARLLYIGEDCARTDVNDGA